MNVVILGQGGREQALAQACLKSKNIKKLFVIPGNPGMQRAGIACVALKEQNEVVQFCVDEKVSLVIPGNEAVILSTIKSELEKYDIRCFSPDPEMARLESSKAYCKKILKSAGILTADFQLIENFESGVKYISEHDFKQPLVLKADGLAQGKGVWVCDHHSAAQTAFGKLAAAFGFPILAEQCMQGRELSAFAICNGVDFTYLGTAVDYKRISPDIFSANTGGMGAFSPCDFIGEQDQKEIENIFRKTLRELKSYQGFLFAGLMKTSEGMAVIEFNVRMGDPETQALLPRIKSDFIDLVLGHQTQCEVSDQSAVHVVMTSGGYPNASMNLGHEVLVPHFEKFYFSGVQEKAGQLINSGGRVLGVTALAKSKESARARAYEAISQVQFEGAYFRKDIGL